MIMIPRRDEGTRSFIPPYLVYNYSRDILKDTEGYGSAGFVRYHSRIVTRDR